MNRDTKGRVKNTRLWMLGIFGILASLLLWTGRVYGADGNLSVAVSSANVPVGNEVKVTLNASGSGGERAVADMEFTYNSNVFSFVSCDADGYSGGEGGRVSFRGSSVTVTLKAVADGSCNLKVTGTNGVVQSSQAALDNMVAAGTTIAAGTAAEPAKSGDNSLASLSLSVGELSPAFEYSNTSYTAEVPYETASVEVTAVASHGRAQITAIEGNTDLQVGENTVKITVKAENGAVAVYTVKVTRAEAPAAPPAPEEPTTPAEGNLDGAGQPSEGTEDQAAKLEEYERQLEDLNQRYARLDEKYRAEKSYHRKVMAVLIFLIAVLVIACVNIVIFMRGRRNRGASDPALSQEKSTLRKSKGAGSGEKKSRRPGPFGRKKKEDWLDEEDEEDMESTIFSSTAIPAPKKDHSSEKSVDFIDLDDL